MTPIAPPPHPDGTTTPRRAARIDAALAVAIGIAAFLMVVGPRVLLPGNIDWLDQGDAATHYLGWAFFRDAPWAFPPGLNPDYGLELGNAIVFSDSNALLAMVFKAVQALLPQPFQYFGLWLLICFVLQSVFAFALVGRVTQQRVPRLLATALFVFAPPLLARLHAHLNLSGHFLLLAALWLALQPADRRKPGAWAMLLPVAALVHAYLLAMAGAIWIADVLGRLLRRSLATARAAIEVGGVLALTGFVCWLAGYFTALDGVVAGGFGLYRMNLLSLVDSNGWSFLLADIPGGPGEYEGFNYLGLGLLFLAACALPVLVMARTGLWAAMTRRPVLLATAVGMTLFALSSTWGLAGHSIVWPVPQTVMKLANVFHASGRMFWPVYYLLYLAIVFVLLRGCGPGVASLVLGLGLVIQVADTSKVWVQIRAGLMTPPAATWRTAMTDPFWPRAAQQYRKVRWLLPGNVTTHWREIAAYAARHGLATDAVFLARVSTQALELAQQQALVAIASGRFEADSLYVVDPALVPQLLVTMDTRRDLLAQVDGFHVVAPGWHQCEACIRGQTAAPQSPPPAPALARGQVVRFGLGQPGQTYLANGWSPPEPAGTWSSGTDASIVMPVQDTPPALLLFEAVPLVGARHPRQTVVVKVNGVDAGTAVLSEASGGRFEVQVPAAAQETIRQSGKLHLQLQFPDARRPVDIGMNNDPRLLAVALVSLTLR